MAENIAEVSTYLPEVHKKKEIAHNFFPCHHAKRILQKSSHTQALFCSTSDTCADNAQASEAVHQGFFWNKRERVPGPIKQGEVYHRIIE